MTDQELLELAAKAAGFLNWTPTDEGLHIETGTRRGSLFFYWYPLTDDGDALRLAVKLGMDVFGDEDYRYAEGVRPRSLVQEPCGNDPYAATRRAIVRAAAEIGKSMEVTK
jgi:hypothetical protein